MRILTIAMTGAAALALSHAAAAAETASNVMKCGSPVAWDATEESLKKQFGADNVVWKDLGGPEGSEMMGTAVNEKTPGRAFSIVWNDAEKRANPTLIFIDQSWNEDYTKASNSEWVSVDGIGSGMPIEDVQKINGKPFKISGFGWDYGGNVTGWEGGKIESAPADPKCGIMVTFTSTAENAPEEAMGDRDLMSNDKAVLASKPVVGRYVVVFVRDEPTP